MYAMPTDVSAGFLALDFRAGFFQLLFHGLGIGLVHAILDRAGCSFDQVLRFLQAEARQFTHDLDDADLLVRRVFLEDDGELRLLLDHGSSGSRARSGSSHRRGGSDAKLLLHVGDQFDHLHDAHVRNRFEDLVL